jgi:hypothetical protein
VFDVFVPVFCVLTMEILEGVVSYVTDEGVRDGPSSVTILLSASISIPLSINNILNC